MKFRIFIIDDEESIRDSFKWYLEKEGHEVYALPDPSFCSVYVGTDCHFKVPCADFLVIDYCMPRMNGIQFLELLEKNECLLAARFIMILTGNQNMVDMSIAKRLNCEVRQKPMTVFELGDWIESHASKISPSRKLPNLSKMDFT